MSHCGTVAGLVSNFPEWLGKSVLVGVLKTLPGSFEDIFVTSCSNSFPGVFRRFHSSLAHVHLDTSGNCRREDTPGMLRRCTSEAVVVYVFFQQQRVLWYLCEIMTQWAQCFTNINPIVQKFKQTSKWEIWFPWIMKLLCLLWLWIHLWWQKMVPHIAVNSPTHGWHRLTSFTGGGMPKSKLYDILLLHQYKNGDLVEKWPQDESIILVTFLQKLPCHVILNLNDGYIPG